MTHVLHLQVLYIILARTKKSEYMKIFTQTES